MKGNGLPQIYEATAAPAALGGCGSSRKLRPFALAGKRSVGPAGVAGVLGALTAAGLSRQHRIVAQPDDRDPRWHRGLISRAGLVAAVEHSGGGRTHGRAGAGCSAGDSIRGKSSTDYMEAILIGSGDVPMRGEPGEKHGGRCSRSLPAVSIGRGGSDGAGWPRFCAVDARPLAPRNVRPAVCACWWPAARPRAPSLSGLQCRRFAGSFFLWRRSSLGNDRDGEPSARPGGSAGGVAATLGRWRGRPVEWAPTRSTPCPALHAPFAVGDRSICGGWASWPARWRPFFLRFPAAGLKSLFDRTENCRCRRG